jgi:hypothetical protein
MFRSDEDGFDADYIDVNEFAEQLPEPGQDDEGENE